MRALIVDIDVRYVRNATWGWNPNVTVDAHLNGVRHDRTYGSASGCGYDKLSAAICYAFRDNPLLQTLTFWKGFNPNPERYGCNSCEKRDYGYSYRFDGQGIGVIKTLMKSNGFDLSEYYDRDGALVHCTFSRDMPESFTALV